MRCVNGSSLTLMLLLAVLASGCATTGRSPEATSPSAQKPESRPTKITEEPVSAGLQQVYDQALAHLKAGRNKEAEQALLDLTKRAPELSGPQANLGVLYNRSGRTKEAIEALKRAIQLNPRRAAYYNELGIIYRKEGKFEVARDQYLKALDADSEYAWAHRNLAILYDLYLQDAKKALLHYQRYQQLLPKEDTMVSKWIIDLQRRTRPADSKTAKEKG